MPLITWFLKGVLYLLLSFFFCTQMVWGFRVKLENVSGRSLSLLCHSEGQSNKIAVDYPIEGATLTYQCDGRVIDRWGYAAGHHDLWFRRFNTNGFFDTKVTVSVINPEDFSLYCRLLFEFRHEGPDSVKVGAWFYVTDVINPCTKDYTDGGARLTTGSTAVVHVNPCPSCMN